MDIKEAIRNYRAEAADLDAEREGQERAAECKQLIVWLGELLALQEKDNSIEVVVYHVIQEIHQRGGGDVRLRGDLQDHIPLPRRAGDRDERGKAGATGREFWSNGFHHEPGGRSGCGDDPGDRRAGGKAVDGKPCNWEARLRPGRAGTERGGRHRSKGGPRSKDPPLLF